MSTLTEVGGSHYAKQKYQPIKLIVGLNLNFFQGNIVKYLTRYRDKNGAEDIQKALHYAQLGASLLPKNNALLFQESVQAIHDYCLGNNLPRGVEAIFVYTLHQNWVMTEKTIESLYQRLYEQT